MQMHVCTKIINHLSDMISQWPALHKWTHSISQSLNREEGGGGEVGGGSMVDSPEH